MKTQKTWFITGAAKGFGFEIVKAALQAGDKVVATVRSKPEQLLAALNNHPDLFIVTLDVTNEEQAQLAVRQAMVKFGRIDVLVNNAGFGLLSAVEEATDAEIKANYETNVFGLLKVIRAVLPQMRKQGSGHIINVSSLFGLGSFAGWGLYGSTKYAVEGITEALALEVAPLGIYATVVEPGIFRTSFLDGNSYTTAANVIADYAETVGKMRSMVESLHGNQPGDPAKLAAAFVKLAHTEKPPLRLPLGNDTLGLYRAKTAQFEQEITEWHDTITTTDLDAVEA